MSTRLAQSTVMAIIENSGDIFLQKRENKPGIVYPGMLHLFGGSLKKGEVPKDGIIRELKEETSLAFAEEDIIFLWDQDFEGIGIDGEKVLKHPYVFHLRTDQNHFEVFEGNGYVRVSRGDFKQYQAIIPRFSEQVMINFWKGKMKYVSAN